MHLTGTPDELLRQMTDQHRELSGLLLKAREIRHNKAIEEYQAAVLFHLAHLYCRKGHKALEIGTARGYSAGLIAQGIVPGTLVTLNPDIAEAMIAGGNLNSFVNVTLLMVRSWDYLGAMQRLNWHFDFIFVDGDHKRVRNDLPFFNQLAVGGMIIFHDYSPDGSARPCQVVYEALNELRDRLGRDFDVLIVDDTDVGMAGFVRQEGEVY